MLTNYHTLSYVVSTLSPRITGAVLSKAYTQVKGELVLAFEGVGTVVVACQPRAGFVYLHLNHTRARRNSTDVLRKAAQQRVAQVGMHGSDRIATIRLEGGDALWLMMFGSNPNVFLVDPAGRIIDAFKDARAHSGRTLTMSDSDVPYDPALLDSALDSQPRRTPQFVIKGVYPTLGPLLAREIACRAGVAPGTTIAELGDATREAIREAFTAVVSELGTPAPRIYFEAAETPVEFSLIRLNHLGHLQQKMFDDIHEAIRFFLMSRRRATMNSQRQRTLGTRLINERLKLSRTIAAIEQDIEGPARADQYERYGSLLMAHLGTFQRGDTEVHIEGEGVEIPLLPQLTPIQNAQRYFEKARKSHAARVEGIERINRLKLRLKETTAALDDLDSGLDDTAFAEKHATVLKALGIGERGKMHEPPPFRVFTVDGGFVVWAGKNSANNDLLTLKHARPQDLWFHARGAGGSHVVLKLGSGKGQPGKKAIAQAAGIAAYYSKMKNASLVPVAMTERKYVRKPKGAPAGAVVIEREKTIFAAPALPSHHDDHRQ